MIAVFGGILAGLTHALMGPDHVAAVAPLALDRHPQPWLAGFRWGVGHSLGVALVGALLLGLRDAVPLHSISAVSERITGLSLLVIGGWALRKAFRLKICTHAHPAGPDTHTHVHLYQEHQKAGRGLTSHAAVVVGVFHGFAGSSHLIGVLPSLALPTLWDSTQYLLAFGLGTIMAMVGLSSAAGSLAGRLLSTNAASYRWVLAGTACVTSGVGLFWVIAGGL
jgi:sulfite exporter TauE/SafE